MTHTRYVCPMPPDHLQRPGLGFARAEFVEDFANRHFIERDGLFFDPEHGHLRQGIIGILWASSTHKDKGSVKAGTAQLIKPPPETWSGPPSTPRTRWIEHPGQRCVRLSKV